MEGIEKYISSFVKKEGGTAEALYWTVDIGASTTDVF